MYCFTDEGGILKSVIHSAAFFRILCELCEIQEKIMKASSEWSSGLLTKSNVVFCIKKLNAEWKALFHIGGQFV